MGDLDHQPKVGLDHMIAGRQITPADPGRQLDLLLRL